MVSVDVSLFIQLANFIVLIWVLNIILYKPMRSILAQRKQKVAELEQGVETSNSEAENKRVAFDEGLKEARLKGVQEKDALLEEAAGEEKKLMDEIAQNAQAELAQVREKISSEAQDVKASLEAQVDSFADAICQKILGRAA